MSNKTPDILYFKIGNKVIKKYKKSNKTEKIDMKSITKLFVIFVLLRMQRSGFLKLTDSIKKHFPDYPYPKIKIIDIINHTSGLQNSWFKYSKKDNKWIPTKLAEKYFESDNIYDFSMKLKLNPKYYGKYRYNNYDYDILGAIIMKITGVTYLDILRKMFPNATFSARLGGGKLPFTSHSLFIYVKDLDYLAKKLLKYNFFDEIKKLNSKYINSYLEIYPKGKYLGHSGSGGQWMLLSKNSIFWALSYGNSDIHKRGISWEEMQNILKKLLN